MIVAVKLAQRACGTNPIGRFFVSGGWNTQTAKSILEFHPKHQVLPGI